jgi:wyosine [tRNA(Phe)-imidazoG37] synthetase (radical SAM superfamily)
MSKFDITFGPVPSRRLGRSLGVNNIPPKICSYSCIYCQVGGTTALRIDRKPFYAPKDIRREVEGRLRRLEELGESVDYLAFVPDGEPTLDSNLGRTIDLLRPLGVKTAVISNSSLLWMESVRSDLARADWVSLKVDAASADVWRRVNRPHRGLELPVIREAMFRFAGEYRGVLVTETMLVRGVNDSPEHVEEAARLLERLQPARAYLSIPMRPPAEGWAAPPDDDALIMARQAFSRHLDQVACLFDYEGDAFSLTGDAAEDLLNIVAVHPMREEAVRKFLKRAGADWKLIDDLVSRGRIRTAVYEGQRFYLRGEVYSEPSDRISCNRGNGAA